MQQAQTHRAPSRRHEVLFSHTGVISELDGDNLLLQSDDGVLRMYQLTPRSLFDAGRTGRTSFKAGDIVRVAAEVEDGLAIVLSLNRVTANIARTRTGRPRLYRVK